MSEQWDDVRIEDEIEREWKAHGETYQYMWVRQLCRRICHDQEARIAELEAQQVVPPLVYNSIMAALAVYDEECGVSAGAFSAREWLRARARRPASREGAQGAPSHQ